MGSKFFVVIKNKSANINKDVIPYLICGVAAAGVVKIVHVPSSYTAFLTLTGGLVGQHLAEHPDVRKVGFTGSTPTGKQIMKRYSQQKNHK